MKALVSIRPEYVERILSGEKTYEYRRRIFKRPQVDTLVIYATMPVGKVVAEAGITGVLESSPEDIWEKTSRHAGISEDRFKAYFHGCGTAYAIGLGDVHAFARPLTLAEYAPGIVRAPQSFVYIHEDVRRPATASD